MSRLHNVREALRYGLAGQGLLGRLRRVGVEIVLYYLVEEGDFHPDASWVAGFASFELCVLGDADMPELVSTRPWIPLATLRHRLAAGHLCIGIREHGRLAAYTWADPRECNHPPNRFALGAGEAYLYEAYSMPAFRGRDIAPFMRWNCYEFLRARGFTRFLSITDYFNSSAARFKQKLNARPIELNLYVNIANRWNANWSIRNLRGTRK